MSKLPLHGLLTLLKVPVLWGGGERGCEGQEPPLSSVCILPQPEPHHKLHEATETPESIHLILNDVENRREKVAHALHIA